MLNVLKQTAYDQALEALNNAAPEDPNYQDLVDALALAETEKMQQLMQSRLLKLNFAPLKMRCLM
jgi:hypothetical protein